MAATLNNETESAIRSQLSPEERLLWDGRPRQGIFFRPADAFMIPFSLLWGGFALFWEYSVVSMDKAPLFFMLWGIPFVAVGLYFIFGRFFVDARQRANTSYGVTNQRVIIVSGILTKKVKSLNVRSLSDLSLDEKSNGSGTISFGASGYPAFWPSGMAWPGIPSPAPAFELRENARTVFEIIRKAQASAA
jgi:hypothetical protein